MKKLFLLRHAKSSWGDDGLEDHERPLAPRGLRATATIGRWLASVGVVPDRALVSSALRTRETYDRVATAAGWSLDVEVTDDLYLCRPPDVVELLRRQDDRLETILVVGHEPTMSGLTSLLAGGGEVKVATGTVVRLGLAVDSWREVGSGCGRVEWVVPPRTLTTSG